jgi:hypothetical protein
MNRRRGLFVTALVLTALLFQFLSFQNVDNASAASLCNSAAFVADVTVPDGTTFNPDTAFVKTWRLKNNGTCTWPKYYGLVFTSGSPLGAPASVAMPVSVAPGQMVDITVNMKAPTTPGSYRGYWMLKNASGVKFGIGTNADKAFWVDIKVASLPTPPPTVPPNAEGLVLQGTVRRDSGTVSGVDIYYSLGYAYPDGGERIATTGSDGRYYQFIPISGNAEGVTVWAKASGYTFEPAIYSWYHSAGLETRTLDFVAAPGTPAPFPGPGANFDFGYRAAEAVWSSGAGTLPYPGSDGDSRGYVLQSHQTTLEDGRLDEGPNLVVGPQNVNNGHIQGVYPAYTVRAGDRFRTSVGCAYSANCTVIFRLDYRIDNGPVTNFWIWAEKNEGQVYFLDKDLGALAGKNVTFILTVLANGSAEGDRAVWGHPRIVNTTPASTTTPAPPTATPSPTGIPPTAPPPAPGTVFDFTADICAARWMTGASLSPQPCPFAEGDSRGFALRVENPRLENGVIDSAPGLLVAPQNKYNGYIQGFFPEYTVQPGDRFQASVGCAYGYSCYVTYRLDYQINNGGIKILWQWSEKNEGKIYQLDKDLSSLAGKKVRFILTLLAAGPATNDRAIWGQPRIVNANYVPPTPTSTPEPSKVTGATVNISVPPVVYCGGPNPVDVTAAITVNGPTVVTYHWEMRGDKISTTANRTVTYPSAGTYAINEGAYKVDCGNYSAQLVITGPNAFASEIFSYSVNPATPTPPPGGNVTYAQAFVEIPPYINCAGSMSVLLVGEIRTDGPTSVTYHWEVGRDGVVTEIMPERVAYFTTGTTLNVSDGALVNCGNYFARLLVTSPNAMSAQVDFPLTIPTLLPIYDFDTFIAIGAIACGEVVNYAWTPETCNGESGGCWVSATPLFGRSHAGFLRHDGITVCSMNLP